MGSGLGRDAAALSVQAKSPQDVRVPNVAMPRSPQGFVPSKMKEKPATASREEMEQVKAPEKEETKTTSPYTTSPYTTSPHSPEKSEVESTPDSVVAQDRGEEKESSQRTQGNCDSTCSSPRADQHSENNVEAVFAKCTEALHQCEQWSAMQQRDFLTSVTQSGLLDLLVEEQDNFGNSLLILAALGQQVEIVELLLRHGAMPDHQNESGFCALHYCSSVLSERAVETVRLLLKYGANPNITENSAACTPLHYAASENNKQVCNLLVSKGAAVLQRCKNGFSAQAYARASGHEELAEALHAKAKRRMTGEIRARIARLEKKNRRDHGWMKHFDEETQKWFYYNSRTRKSTWDRPLELDSQDGGESEQSTPGSASSNSSSEVDSFESTHSTTASSAEERKGLGGDTAVFSPHTPEGEPDAGEVERLKRQLEEMQARLEEAQSIAAREADEKAQIKRLSAQVDERLEQELRKLKRELASKAESDAESAKRVEQLRSDYEEQKRREVEKLKEQLLQERSAEIREMESKQAEERSKHERELEAHMQQLSEMGRQLQAELKEKKQYYNQIEELKGSIRVCARVRPLDRREKERGCKQVVEVFGNNIKVEIKKVDPRTNKERSETKTFSFDKCLGTHSSQEDVFEDSERLIQSAVDGFNVCIFAYGQTGAGKTYTMSGPSEDPGILPRAVQALFKCMERTSVHYEFTTELYMCELHLDSLVDLQAEGRRRIGDTSTAFQIKKDEFGVVYVENINVVGVSTQDELMELIRKGEMRRSTDSTNMNDASSRSHLVISIIIKSENRKTQEITSGKLTLVDLAGSERVEKSGAEGQTFKEATSINMALSALGEVINALTSGSKHVPYRNNPLTQLMSDSIGGNAKTLMVVNISPADYNVSETISSLNFATRCKSVRNAASKGFETKEIAMLRKEIQRLRKQNHQEEL